MPIIDPISQIQYSDPNQATDSPLPVKTLNQQDFLKLLVAQMTSQDPTNPKSDIEMIPQMVQFSMMEQTKTMQTDIAQLRSDNQFVQANSLIGRTVQIHNTDGSKKSGVVSGVQVNAGTPQIVINGSSYDLSQVIDVSSTAATTQH